jgi:alpha-N-arabinofuranosidase
MISKKKFYLFVVFVVTFNSAVFSQTRTALTVQVNKPVAEVQPTMWGIFFEDINFGADGGLYAELVKNRSFEFDVPLMGWREEKSDRFSINSQSGAAMIVNQGHEQPNNPRFARITVNADNAYAMINEGFHGMGIKKDLKYNFSVLSRVQEGNVSIVVELVDDQQKVIGSSTLRPDNKEWKKYLSEITPATTSPKTRLRLSFRGTGVVDIDMVSLFPTDTWKNRPEGLRADLVQLLYDLKPGFLRFPGGCIVEGRDLSQRYQWKKTVGDIEDRQLLINRWNTEFKHRPAPDYYQSFGLGFYEYFLLSEDLGAEPLPILSCGIACQFNTAEVVPMDQIDPYIQDALDLIEFANGPVTSKWGKLRADMGHADPFNMKFIGVGNEQWGPQYIERYKVFEKAIKAKYPSMKIVSGSGPFPEGELFDYAWEELKELNAEIVDEHYYKNPGWFLENATRYDKYDRKGPKIFAGEYAAQSVAIASPDNKNNWECALSEAAFMTGLERNADVVHLTSYAPLMAHAEKWQWTPDLIWFDNLSAYGTPNYYVQKLFSNNKGTNVIPVLSGKENVTGQKSLYASAVWDKNTKEIIVKLVNASNNIHDTEITLEGSGKLASAGTVTVLTSENKGDVNTLNSPQNIAPKEERLAVKGKKLTLSLAPQSLTVVKVKSM